MTQIYTDGGCSGNPGPGGWAYVIIKDSTVIAEKWGAEKSTTNNRMELLAAISALEALSSFEAFSSLHPDTSAGNEKISIYTDSQYVQKGITVWIKDWKNRGWKTSDKKQVKNQELWQCLDALAAGFSLEWVWIKGHAGNEFNERCDKLTQKAIASL